MGNSKLSGGFSSVEKNLKWMTQTFWNKVKGQEEHSEKRESDCNSKKYKSCYWLNYYDNYGILERFIQWDIFVGKPSLKVTILTV